MRLVQATLLLFLTLLPPNVLAADLTFTTFNVRFYGEPTRNGPTLEERDRALKSFIEGERLRTDVIALQEIVDKARLEREVLGSDYRCVSYPHASPDHLHVVVCHKRNLDFTPVPGDSDYGLEELDLGNPRYRPAVHGILRDGNGRALARVIAVHLKASEDAFELRERQAAILARYIGTQQDGLPVVLLGDMNTHAGDLTRFNRIFASHGVALRHIYSSEPFTWRVPEKGRKFDRVWISREARVLSYPDVVGPCNVAADRVEEIKAYNHGISDHCPVRFTVRF